MATEQAQRIEPGNAVQTNLGVSPFLTAATFFSGKHMPIHRLHVSQPHLGEKRKTWAGRTRPGEKERKTATLSGERQTQQRECAIGRPRRTTHPAWCLLGSTGKHASVSAQGAYSTGGLRDTRVAAEHREPPNSSRAGQESDQTRLGNRLVINIHGEIREMASQECFRVRMYHATGLSALAGPLGAVGDASVCARRLMSTTTAWQPHLPGRSTLMLRPGASRSALMSRCARFLASLSACRGRLSLPMLPFRRLQGRADRTMLRGNQVFASASPRYTGSEKLLSKPGAKTHTRCQRQIYKHRASARRTVNFLLCTLVNPQRIISYPFPLNIVHAFSVSPS